MQFDFYYHYYHFEQKNKKLFHQNFAGCLKFSRFSTRNARKREYLNFESLNLFAINAFKRLKKKLTDRRNVEKTNELVEKNENLDMEMGTTRVNSRLSATIGTRQILVDNRGWRIIERGGESRAVELRKSVPMVLMADNR